MVEVTQENVVTGRLVYARILPNEDLVTSIEQVAADLDIKRAFIRGSLGSLTDACLHGPKGQETFIQGPAVEIVSIFGELQPDTNQSVVAKVTGVVADPQGDLSAGEFVRGRNPVCVTFELALEEWIPSREISNAPSV